MILSLLMDIMAFSTAFTIIFISINRCNKTVYIQVFMTALLIESAFVIFGLQMFSLLPIVAVEAFIFLCRSLIKRYFPRHIIDNITLLIIINVIGTVIMTFISVIAPLFLLYNKETMSFYIMFTIFLIFAVVFSVYVMKEETEKSRLEYNKFVEKHYEEISRFRHYYGKLYRTMSHYVMKKDMDGIMEIYDSYITPEHTEYIEKRFNYDMLALVKLPLINRLLYDIVTNLRDKNIPLNLYIEEVISTENIKELDLFKIMANLLDNAIQETETQKDGYINIYMSENEKGTNIRIENTFKSNINISLIYMKGYTTKKDHTGAGLPEVWRIADSYHNVSLLTYIELHLFIQNIIIE